MDSDEEDYYCSDHLGSEEDEIDKSSEDDGVDAEIDSVDVSRLPQNYKILKEDDIKRLLENEISTVSNTLSVARGVACALLCRNNWNPSAAYDDWFATDEDKPSEPTAASSKRKSRTEVCTICYEEIETVTMISAACGHPFCPNCWKTYISISIKDGPGCVTLSCPESNCKSIVGLDMIDSLSSDHDKTKYYQFLHRSYVESHRARKWCPSPGCDFAIEFDGAETYEVTCDCSFKFCWNCAEESHRPVDCNMVAKWIEKNSSEAENTTWILAYTKPCPKCGRSIEKNQGCNHMTCRTPCVYEFCWVCLGSWKKHDSNYNCNIYKEEDQSEKTRKLAKKHLERYTHYFERWDSNDKARKRALLDLSRARNEHFEMLAERYGETHGQLQFVIKAWDQIVECRRVLKWTYAYGYYLYFDNESRKMGFFEYLQREAETALETLHHCAEKEMEKYLNGDIIVRDFNDFRTKLTGLTSVTKTYFENLVRALENNLSEVESTENQRS